MAPKAPSLSPEKPPNQPKSQETPRLTDEKKKKIKKLKIK
jgi:hypothetical protein